MTISRTAASGFWLGLAFGGFFDGILLHQVLQWHHLFSGIDSGWFGELRHQVIADGVFHAVMYVVAGWGLVTLVRHRHQLGQPGSATHWDNPAAQPTGAPHG